MLFWVTFSQVSNILNNPKLTLRNLKRGCLLLMKIFLTKVRAFNIIFRYTFVGSFQLRPIVLVMSSKHFHKYFILCAFICPFSQVLYSQKINLIINYVGLLSPTSLLICLLDLPLKNWNINLMYCVMLLNLAQNKTSIVLV